MTTLTDDQLKDCNVKSRPEDSKIITRAFSPYY